MRRGGAIGIWRGIGGIARCDPRPPAEIAAAVAEQPQYQRREQWQQYRSPCRNRRCSPPTRRRWARRAERPLHHRAQPPAISDSNIQVVGHTENDSTGLPAAYKVGSDVRAHADARRLKGVAWAILMLDRRVDKCGWRCTACCRCMAAQLARIDFGRSPVPRAVFCCWPGSALISGPADNRGEERHRPDAAMP